ncbi:MAG: lysophospholipid acyltransferase family protein [Acidobacteriota bacterium]
MEHLSEIHDLDPDAYAQPRLVDGLARGVLDVFFRRVEVQGADRIPEEGPVVLVGNHVNGLLDPAVFAAYLPRTPRFLGKSTLWKIAALRPFIRLAAAIPVYRRTDPGVDPTKNAETFRRCHEVLAAGGAIAIFPEGRSHDEPGLVELKTGVSRIVLQAEERFPGVGTRIVPVGLTFDDKTRFRSRLLLRVGDPIDPAPELEAYGADPRGAVRRLTERVRAGLEAVTLSYGSWDEARLIERAAEIWSRPVDDAPAERSLADAFDVRRAFLDGYNDLLERCPEEVHGVAEEVREYDELLDLHRLRDAEVASRYPPSTVLRFVAKSLWLLLVRLPLGFVGILINALPYRLADVLSRRFGSSRDVVATYKVFPALVLYPVTWLAVAVIAGWFAGLWIGVAAFFLGPITGVFAVRYLQRQRFFLRQARAFLLLRSGRRGVAELRRQRQRVLGAVRALARRLDPDPGPQPA